MDFWWPPGHIVGWGDTFTHEMHHLLSADRRRAAPSRRTAPRSRTATAAPVICDAIVELLARPGAGRRSSTKGARRMKTSLGIWAFGSMATRFVPGGYQPEYAGESTAQRVRRAVGGLGDLIDGYEFHYPQELTRTNLDEVREALDGHGIYCIATGLHLDPQFGRGGLVSPGRGHPGGGASPHRRGRRLRRLARRALHHLAGDRGLQLPVPDALRGELGLAHRRDRRGGRALRASTASTSSSSTRTRSPR